MYATIWQARQLTHLVMLKLLLFTGIRHAELVRLCLTAVALQTCQVRMAQGQGQKDRSVLIPTSCRGALAQYMERQRPQGARARFASNRPRPSSTRRIRPLVNQSAVAAGLEQRVYPHLFRHQLSTYLTRHGMIRPKLQLLSGQTTAPSLAVYRALARPDVAEASEAARRPFPVRYSTHDVLSQLPSCGA